MIMPEVSCTAVAIHNSSEWPCTMCAIPQAQTCWGEDILYIFFLIFPGHLEFWTPLQIRMWGSPLGCTLFHDLLLISLTIPCAHLKTRRGQSLLSPLTWSTSSQRKELRTGVNTQALWHPICVDLGKSFYFSTDGDDENPPEVVG